MLNYPNWHQPGTFGANCGEDGKPVLLRCGAVQARSDIPTCTGRVCPASAAGEQSGDRQRREKGPPILTAEKGEHERAPSVGEIYLSSLRATLRAPPPKWAIKAFFPECRAAGFLWYFLSLRKKVLPSSGRQPHRPRRSRRVKPPQPSWRIALLAGRLSAPPTRCAYRKK